MHSRLPIVRCYSEEHEPKRLCSRTPSDFKNCCSQLALLLEVLRTLPEAQKFLQKCWQSKMEYCSSGHPFFKSASTIIRISTRHLLKPRLRGVERVESVESFLTHHYFFQFHAFTAKRPSFLLGLLIDRVNSNSNRWIRGKNHLKSCPRRRKILPH